MKRLILIAAFILTAGTLAAQNYIIVNSEKVFKSIDAYNTAISDLDKLAKQYQDQVDAKFAEVEALYNNYVSQKTSLSAAARQTRENAILNKEKEAQEYQESLFGQEGTLMKKRIEVISPIQKQVFFRHRGLRQAGGRRPGARLGEQPHAALHQSFRRADAAGDRRAQEITDIKTLTDKTV